MTILREKVRGRNGYWMIWVGLTGVAGSAGGVGAGGVDVSEPDGVAGGAASGTFWVPQCSQTQT
ncbi:hypothetical protein HYS82_02250 [Candidatus Amesbacteria bacterium]|nr:hypothetical protein [Candidatus Amesbacteria bacterium]